MNQKKRNEWLRIIAWLKKNFPIDDPVHVRTMSPVGTRGSTRQRKRNWGSAWFNPETREFEVRINSQKPFDLRIYILIHEWAHVITWHKIYARIIKRRKGESFHSKEFGIAYAKIYRTYSAWNYKRKTNES